MLYFVYRKQTGTRKASIMATYRYARESRTSAQKAGRAWNLKVDAVSQELRMYEAQIADGRQLSNYDAMRQRNAEKRLARLMAENPFEAA